MKSLEEPGPGVWWNTGCLTILCPEIKAFHVLSCIVRSAHFLITPVITLLRRTQRRGPCSERERRSSSLPRLCHGCRVNPRSPANVSLCTQPCSSPFPLTAARWCQLLRPTTACCRLTQPCSRAPWALAWPQPPPARAAGRWWWFRTTPASSRGFFRLILTLTSRCGRARTRWAWTRGAKQYIATLPCGRECRWQASALVP